MSCIEELYTRALLESLCAAPLLVGDLPEAPAWEAELQVAGRSPALNFEQKLGHLYEDALALLIEGSERWELLAKNLQVQGEGGQTLGEMDFLVKDRESGWSFQLELAVKFYLSVWEEDGSERYPGPDPRDNWINKLERMRERQLRLAKRPEARRLLEQRFGLDEVSVCQRVYGFIFDPMGEARLSAPPKVRASARRAKWLRVSEFRRWFPELEAVKLVPKCLWPALLGEELLASLASVPVGTLLGEGQQRCTLFWAGESEGVVFLVPDRWPEYG
ncbi:DUF1853 family protein [Pelagicoccus sp. SDUM812005]|uniref:DUF1853 family protein n=1 Tax=Pelagicoccus sp. SDUM812005 TaxID=3041257 RepID=UPI00280F4C9A|nr:DUF1853 family protein [Pelagicoccus sp. SDUM812005]MDQ8182654.1 DUF1853 family protein [Pelagicoccus sp. SDUM812005]